MGRSLPPHQTHPPLFTTCLLCLAASEGRGLVLPSVRHTSPPSGARYKTDNGAWVTNHASPASPRRTPVRCFMKKQQKGTVQSHVHTHTHTHTPSCKHTPTYTLTHIRSSAHNPKPPLANSWQGGAVTMVESLSSKEM